MSAPENVDLTRTESTFLYDLHLHVWPCDTTRRCRHECKKCCGEAGAQASISSTMSDSMTRIVSFFDACMTQQRTLWRSPRLWRTTAWLVSLPRLRPCATVGRILSFT
eukprot:6210146-Pleurochrysis_carterae.AAC.4